MPTYEYECAKCGKIFEAHQSMSEAPLTACEDPKCKGKVRRLIGAGGGFIFKGSGFYQTDYKNSGAPKVKDASNAESVAKADAKSESKSDSKSESKAETKPASGGGGGCGSGCGCAKH